MYVYQIQFGIISHLHEGTSIRTILLQFLATDSGIKTHLRISSFKLRIRRNQGNKLRVIGCERRSQARTIQGIEITIVVHILEGWCHHRREDSRGCHLVHSIEETISANLSSTLMNVCRIKVHRSTKDGFYLSLFNFRRHHRELTVSKHLHHEISLNQRIQTIDVAISLFWSPECLEELSQSLVGWRKDTISL